MAETDCAATIAYGMEATTDGCDLLVVRGIAAGGQASTTAMTAALLGDDNSLNEQRIPAEIEIVGKAIATHKSHYSRRWSCFAGWAGGKLQPLPVPLWPRGCSRYRLSWTDRKPCALHCYWKGCARALRITAWCHAVTCTLTACGCARLLADPLFCLAVMVITTVRRARWRQASWQT